MERRLNGVSVKRADGFAYLPHGDYVLNHVTKDVWPWVMFQESAEVIQYILAPKCVKQMRLV